MWELKQHETSGDLKLSQYAIQHNNLLSSLILSFNILQMTSSIHKIYKCKHIKLCVLAHKLRHSICHNLRTRHLTPMNQDQLNKGVALNKWIPLNINESQIHNEWMKELYVAVNCCSSYFNELQINSESN